MGYARFSVRIKPNQTKPSIEGLPTTMLLTPNSQFAEWRFIVDLDCQQLRAQNGMAECLFFPLGQVSRGDGLSALLSQPFYNCADAWVKPVQEAGIDEIAGDITAAELVVTLSHSESVRLCHKRVEHIVGLTSVGSTLSKAM
jgi:hypothetical protein